MHLRSINIQKGKQMKTKKNSKRVGKKRGPKPGKRKKPIKAARKPRASTAEKKKIKRLTVKMKNAIRSLKAIMKIAVSIQKDIAFVMSK